MRGSKGLNEVREEGRLKVSGQRLSWVAAQKVGMRESKKKRNKKRKKEKKRRKKERKKERINPVTKPLGCPYHTLTRMKRIINIDLFMP